MTPLILSDGTNSCIYGPARVHIEQIGSEGQMDYRAEDALAAPALSPTPVGMSSG